jgi:hypothetical protein
MIKFIKDQLKDQKGIALIAMVFLLWFLAVVAISEMLVTTGTQLSRTNLEIALTYAENTAISTTGPIKRAMEDQIGEKIKKDLDDHLTAYLAAKNSIQVGGAGSEQPPPTYICQGTVPADSIGSVFSICDPIHLLDNLSGANNRTIDELGLMKSLTPAEYQNGYEWEEIKRESFNEYNYTLKVNICWTRTSSTIN